ncbi:hypothetical protein [Saccharomonospora sp. CUA-673]|uniref:hypothetical protein n=1 Tax=Saccharomonospora sp. CUA-673 TaxID=1904969 RepID=UPI0021010659|nr:hypothetical protein [Saccharomonospora sp. CUA-673]
MASPPGGGASGRGAPTSGTGGPPAEMSFGTSPVGALPTEPTIIRGASSVGTLPSASPEDCA